MFSPMLRTMEQGGWIMWPIVAVSCVVWWLGLWKLRDFQALERSRRSFLRFLESLENRNPCAALPHDPAFDPLYRRITPAGMRGTGQALAEEFRLETSARCHRGMSTIAVWISVAPLLGLLGTVAGMMRTFRVITVFGTGNPALTAEGISIALLTTEFGLIVAFPGLLLHTFVNNRKNRILRLLEDGCDRALRFSRSANTENGAEGRNAC